MLKIEAAHEGVINDTKFSNINPHVFGTASDDHHYKLWDIRQAKPQMHSYSASEDDLLVISFSHFNEHLFTTGGEQSGCVHVWDTRMPKIFINDLLYHKQ